MVHYHRIEFERYQPPQPVDCVVASTSLHHVDNLDNLDVVLDQVAAVLVPDGALDERAAIDAGRIQATGIRYAGTRR